MQSPFSSTPSPFSTDSSSLPFNDKGEPTGVYPLKHTGSIGLMLGGIASMLVGVCVLATHIPNSPENRPFGLFWLILGILPFSCGIIIWRNCVRTYRKGFEVQRGISTWFVRFDQIDSVFQHTAMRRSKRSLHEQIHTFTVNSKGRHWQFGQNIKNVEELGTNIEVQVAIIQLPQLMADYHAGNPVTFGDLRFDSLGVGYKSNTVSWADFDRVDISQGRLSIYSRSDSSGRPLQKTITVSGSNLPNIYTIAGFATQVMQERNA